MCKTCSVGITVQNGNLINYNPTTIKHNHPNHLSEINKDKFSNEIKCKIKENPTQPNRSHYDQTLKIQIENKNDLPLYNQCKSRFAKFRKNFIPYEPKDSSREQFKVDDIMMNYFNTLSGDQFYQIDRGE